MIKEIIFSKHENMKRSNFLHIQKENLFAIDYNDTKITSSKHENIKRSNFLYILKENLFSITMTRKELLLNTEI